MHASGPDDIYDAETWDEATRIAHAINEEIREYAARRPESEFLTLSWATPYRRDHAIAAGVI